MAVDVQSLIGEFLAETHLVMVGVSRDSRHYSHRVFDEFRRRGVEVVPVNPLAKEVDFEPTAQRVTDVEPRPRSVLLLTPPDQVETAARDCAEAGAARVWIRRPAKPNTPERRAVELLTGAGIPVLTGVCPFMVLPDTALFHRFHGFIARLTNTVGEAFAPQPSAS